MKLFASYLIGLLLVASVAGSAETSADDAETQHEQAVAAYQDGDYERAVELLNAERERNPQRASSLYWLSLAYERLGKVGEAIGAAERLHDQGYRNPADVSYRLAQLHARIDNPEQALRWLEQSLKERYDDRPGIGEDPAFASLRRDPRFARLAGIPPADDMSRDEGWRFDLDYLVAEAQRMHAGPSRPAFSETFAARALALRTAIPDLTNDQVLTEMMRLIALLGDGHSAIYGPAPQQDSPVEFTAGVLPYKFYWFPDGLYIVDGIGEAAKDAGQRVVRFGGFTAEDVLARLSAYRGGDNSMTWRWMGPQFYVGSLLLLKEAGATASRETVDMTLEAPDGRVITRTVKAGRFDIPRKLRPYPSSRARPLYLSRVDTNYWLEELPEHRALYFQFNQVRDAETESLATFADRLRRTLAKRRIESLIVDVRHNNGGNNSLVGPLVRAMVDFEMADRQHRVFVIMGRNTFSAAQNFLNEMERWTDATFVGEPSSSSPNFVGEETNVLLPYSRVMGSISTQYWQDSDPGDRRPWIDPDIPCAPTAADHFDAGRDPCLDVLLKELEKP